ncbi:hypothetical protein X975_19444, partial [Stegodyphus mimosarum]
VKFYFSFFPIFWPIINKKIRFLAILKHLHQLLVLH